MNVYAIDSRPLRRVRAPLGARENTLASWTQPLNEDTDGRVHFSRNIQRDEDPHPVSPSRLARRVLQP
jgi:hypothetical protein